ncbi:9508_t:CDS:2 [Cetraspora pellucida]|uniref:9508_t:CDS:1 n=1 Tax=Cetraspora pellucida TaxID=1433469 RepID=A0ACA9K1I6_9GLOM|nr:9508_t:CDS:2 [Cetraspora pellucida]
MAINLSKYSLFLSFYNSITGIKYAVHALNVNPINVYSLTGILVRNKIYYHGGLQRTETDDFITRTLPSSDIMNLSEDDIDSIFLSFPYHNAFHVKNNQLNFFGGRHSQQADDDEQIFGKYNAQNNKWDFFQSSTEFPFNLQDYSCAMTDNGLFVIFGGKFPVSGTATYSNDIFITNINSKNWGSYWIKPIFTYGPGSRTCMHYILPLISILTYTISDNDFITVHSATILPNGKMVVLGGQTNDSIFVPMSEIWVYDININEWQDIVAEGDIPSPRIAHSAILTLDSKIIIYGGMSDVKMSQPLAVLDTSLWFWSHPKIISSFERVGKQLTITFGNDPNMAPFDDITILNMTIWAIDSTFVPNTLSFDDKMLSSNGQITLGKRDTVEANNVINKEYNPNEIMYVVIFAGIAIILAGSITFILYIWFGKRRKRRQKRDIKTKSTAADHISMILGFFGKSLETNKAPELELDSIIEPLQFNYQESLGNSGTGTPLSPISPNHIDHSQINHLMSKSIPSITLPKPEIEPSRTPSPQSHHVSPSQSTSSTSQFIKSDMPSPIIRPHQVYRINSRILRSPR